MFIPARWFTRGRITDVDLLVLHSAEGATTAAELGRYFAKLDRKASAHAGVGQKGALVQYVHYSDTAYAAPGANADGDHLELCGFAAWSTADWMAHPDMLDGAARWLARRATARRIPLIHLSVADLLADKRGVCAHVDVTNAFHLSTHVDPGRNFPWDYVLRRASYWQTRWKVGPVRIPKPRPKPGPATRTPVPYPGHVIERGSTDARAVREVQRRLRRHGIDRLSDGRPVRVDGDYGPITRSAVLVFQRSVRLADDGVVGRHTWAALEQPPAFTSKVSR